MIGVVAGKEFKELTRDGRFHMSSLLLLILFSVAVLTGWQRHVEISAERDVAEKIIHEQWLSQGEKNPHAAAHYGIYAFQPLGPLAYFDSAVINFTGASIWLEAHKQNIAKDRPASDMTSVQRFGDMTGAFVLQLLLPLMIIFLSFAAFAGEREQGTLRQKLSVGVSPRVLLLGKALGISLPLSTIIGLAAVLGIGVLVSVGSMETVPRFIILSATYLIYGLIFLALGLAVSAVARTAQTALVVLVGLWVVSSFVVPRLGVAMVQYIYPVPSSIEFAEAMARDMENGVDGVSQTERIRELRQRTLARYGVNNIAELPVNFEGLSFILLEQLGDAVFDKHYGSLQQAFENQERVLQFLAVISPLLAVQNISSALAGTSLTDAHHFANSAEAFRRKFVRQMNEDLAFNSQSGETSYRAGPELWATVSSYEYQPRSLEEVLSSVSFSTVVMFVWLAITSATAFAAASRLKRAAFE